jgi:hypothetical protein
MPIVSFGPLGDVEFPEDWSEQQLDEHLKANGKKIRADLLQANQAANAQEAQDEAGPDTVLETIGSMAGSFNQADSQMAAGLLRTVGRVGNAAAAEASRSGEAGLYADFGREEEAAAERAAAPVETPAERMARVDSGPLFDMASQVEANAQAETPTLPSSAAGFWTGDVPAGFGSAGAMVGLGLLAGPAVGLAVGFGAEADDAWSSEIARQKDKGETPDMDKALAKSLGYATVATAIESGLGAGRIIRKLKSKFGGNTVEETVNSAIENGVSGTLIGLLLKGGAGDAAAGFTEELLQSIAENLIVHGTPNLAQGVREGAAGGVVQAILGIPANAKARRQVTSQTARDAAAAGLQKTGGIVADMSNAAEVLTPDLTEADVADLYADPQPVGTQSETDAVIAAAEVARKAAQAAQTLPTEPVATEGTGEDPAAVAAVEPIAEPSTPAQESNEPAPAEAEGQVDPEPGVRQGDTGNLVTGVPTGSVNGGGTVPADTTGTGTQPPVGGVGAAPADAASSVETGEGVVPEPGAAGGNQRTDPVRPGVQTGNGPAQTGQQSAPVLPGKIRETVPPGVAPAEVNPPDRAISSSDFIKKRKYTPAAQATDGSIYTADDHPLASYKITDSGKTVKARGYVTQSGEFLSLMDVAKQEIKEKEDAEREAKRPKNLGKNRRGFEVFEDENGVRSYVDGGVRVTEDVQLVPTRTGMQTSVDVSKRGSDYLTEQEWRDKQGQGNAQQKPGVSAYRKVMDWMNSADKAGNPIGRYANAIQNVRKIRIDPTVENDLLSLLRLAGVENVPLQFEGEVYDEFWSDFGNQSASNAGDQVQAPASAPAPVPTPSANKPSVQTPLEKAIETVDGEIMALEEELKDIKDGNTRAGPEYVAKRRAMLKERKQTRKDLMAQYRKEQAAQAQASSPNPVTTQGTPPAAAPKDAKLAEIQAKRDAIKKRLRDKLGGVSSGIDPEIAVIAAELAVTYVEEGVVRFPDFAKRVKSEMGDIWDSLKTYLHGAWASAGTVQPDAVESTRAESAAAIAALDAPKEEVPTPADTAGDQDVEVENEAPSTRRLEWGQFEKIPQDLTVIVRAALDRGEKVARRDVNRLAKEAGIEQKVAEEFVESAVVISARNIVQQGMDPLETFRKLVDLYNRMPVLGTRTVTSKINQAYSTPPPLAYLGGMLADIPTGTRVVEPTVGNAMLTITVSPEALLILNEFDPARAQRAADTTGQQVTQLDATSQKYFDQLKEKKPDRAAMNPPFGSVVNTGATGNTQFTIINGVTHKGTTPSVDLAIMLNTLEALEKDGKAFIIIGSKTGGIGNTFGTVENRRAAYNRPEFLELFHRFNVTDWFTVSGDLYKRMGAGFPVDVIVVDGKTPTKRSADGGMVRPWIMPPAVYTTWDQLSAKLIPKPNETDSTGTGSGNPVGGTGATIPPAGASGPAGGAATTQGTAGNAGTGTSDGGTGIGGQPGQPALPPAGTSLDQLGSRPVTQGNAGVSSDVASQPAGSSARPVAARTATDSRLNSPYVPVSNAPDPKLVVPSNLAAGHRNAIIQLEAETGMKVDDYAAKEMNLPVGDAANPKKGTLYGSFSAAQIEAIALFFHAATSRQSGIINSDQTGVGKGRTIAAVIKWAISKGKIPIFVTAKPSLYSDMAGRDLPAIGETDVNPFITNATLLEPWINGKGDAVPQKSTVEKQTAAMQKIASTGKLPSGVNAIFTTYDQLGADKFPGFSETKRAAAARKREGIPRADGPRMAMLRAIAPNAIFILDEAHLAAGPNSEVGMLLRSVIPNSFGVYGASATFAKRPDNMPLYAAITGMGDIGLKPAALTEMFVSGGVPFQQAVSAMMATGGELVRREQSFEGVPFNFVKSNADPLVEVNAANAYSGFLQTLLPVVDEMSAEIAGMVDSENGQRAEGQEINLASTSFASRLFNLSSQYLFALRAKAAVNQAIAAVNEGKKPFIAFYNTMAGPIADLQRLRLPLNFNGLLLREIEKAMTRNVRDPLVQGGRRTITYRIEDFSEGLQEKIRSLQDAIRSTDFGAFPISPVDYIRKGLEAAGISVGEVSGRGAKVTENEDGSVSTEDRDDPGVIESFKKFNSGVYDALLVNTSGAVGLSAHSDPKYKGNEKASRPRRMIVVQPAPDINQFMQMLGRVMRFGQLNLPSYDILSTSLAAETRFMTMLRSKLTSLNANTTADTESGITADLAQDVFNEVGDEVVHEILSGDMEAVEAAGITMPDLTESGSLDDFARKATGRFVLLSNDRAKNLWDQINAAFKNRIEALDSTGENPLKADVLDLQAKTTGVSVAEPSSGSGIFRSEVLMERVDIKPPQTPYTWDAASDRKASPGSLRQSMTEWMNKQAVAKQQRVEAARAAGQTDAQVDALIALFDNVAEKLSQLYRLASLPATAYKVTNGKPSALAMIHRINLSDRKPEDFTSASNHTVYLSTNSARNEIRIPLSQVDVIEPIPGVTSRQEAVDLWDKTTENRTTRYILTGNIVKAKAIAPSYPSEFNPRITMYSTANGGQKTGIMLGADFNPENGRGGSTSVVGVTAATEELAKGNRLTNQDLGLVINPGPQTVVEVFSSGSGKALWGDRGYADYFTGELTERRGAFSGTLKPGRLADFLTFVMGSKQVRLTKPAGAATEITFSEPAATGDRVLDALNKAIDATSTQGKLFDVVAGVSMSAANTILKAVRAAYVGGKALTAAIRDAIADYRAAHPKTKMDDTAMSDWLSSQVTGAADVTTNAEGRRTVNMGGTRAESEAIEWLKSPEFLYVRETEAGRMEAARKIIDSFGGDLRAALRFVTVPDQMSGVTASISEVTAAEIANRAHEKAMAAANTPDVRQWEALRDQAIQVAKGFLSGQGQGLQAGNQVAKTLGAGAAVAEYQERLRYLRDKALAKKFPEVTAMRIKDWLDEAARRAVAEIKTTMAKADNVVARLLKQARADYGQTWSEIMQASAAAQGNHRREIFRRIKDHPKLQGIDRAGALELTNLLVNAWEKERMAIFRREFRKQVALPNVREEDMAKLHAATPAFVRQLNLGLWDNEAFRNAVAPQFGVKAVTQEASSRIYAAAQVAQAAPEGPQRQTKYKQLAQMIAREAGVPPSEIIRGWWYASVLSGSGTQARNFLGNTAQLVDNFVAFSARSPQDIPRLISGLLRGMAQNATGEFGAILLRGQESTGRVGEDIRNAGSAAETMAGDARLWARLFSQSKYVGRFMSAVDSFFYAANAEMMAQFMAVRAGRAEGVSTRAEMNDYISSVLKLEPGQMAAARMQAQAESDAGLLADKAAGTVNRRAYQILSENRPADIRQEMHRFALEATLNNTPEGIMGAIATSIINLRERFPVLTPVVPFVRISANVTNMLLDHSPAALVKLIAARPDGYRILGYDGLRYPNRRLTEEQFQQLRAKVVIGGTMTIALAIAAGLHLDDDEPPFQITGSLDSLDFQKRRQLAEQGIKPYQIRFGNVGVDYRQTPLAMMLTMIGSVMDGIRYSKFDEKEESVKWSAVQASGLTVIVDQSFLSGLQSILDRGTYGGQSDIGARFARGAASTIGGMVPRMAKDIDQMVNPDLKQAKGFWDNLLKEMPVARWSLQSRKNVLGEDVQRQAWPWSATISTENTDPVWQELNRKAQAGVFLPVPSASARILKNGERVKMTDEQFDEYTTMTGEGYRKALEKDLSKIQKMTPEQFEGWIKETLTPIRERVRSEMQ